MAILQISRITNRKGLTENLPQLSGAELGWCIDSRRLFIGNGTLQDGAPVIGNTELLTQFSDISGLSTYTYKDVVVGYTAQTGPTPNTPVVRSVQAKLDDFADVRDFGAVGDGVADDTDAINRALYQLYCRENNSQIRRTLYFPAGTYRVSESIVIPTYAKLVGEGANCSIIYLDVQGGTVPDYVAMYGDSRQQTGPNIGNNGAVAPRNIEISSMTFQSLEYTNIFFAEMASQCYFDSVNFIGPVTTEEIIDPGFNPAFDDYSGVKFNSNGTLITNQLTFDKCLFSNLTYGIYGDVVTESITVSNGKFDTLYQGIYLDVDVTGFRALSNMFDNIYAEGVYFNDVSMNMTAHNAFYNVGYAIGSSTPTSPVITFYNDNNVSLSDMFERSDVDSNTYPRVSILGSTTVSGGTQIQLGRYAREVGHTASLTNNTSSATTIFTINTLIIKAFTIDYTITRTGITRTGAMRVTGSNYDDEFSQDGATGVTLSATKTGDTVSVKYTTTNTGDNAIFTYSISHLA
jgi:hypothetical protein